MYSVFVAADCNGEKVNLQFTFEFGPSVSQVLSRATEAFRVVFLQRHLQRPFAVSAVVIFNEVTSTWDRLERSTQLSHNCQVYVFQPDILDVPSEIGDAIPASTYLGNYASPSRDSPQPSPRPAIPTTYEPRSIAATYTTPIYSNYASPFLEGASSPNPYSLANSSRYERNVNIASHYSSSPKAEYAGSSDSILRQERQRIERQSSLPLDQMREELRREVREFSASPERAQRY